jgi:hypothetical protein
MDSFIDNSNDYDEEVSHEIRKMFKYDPKKYQDRDDDVDNMEVGYAEIMREEKQRYFVDLSSFFVCE